MCYYLGFSLMAGQKINGYVIFLHTRYKNKKAWLAKAQFIIREPTKGVPIPLPNCCLCLQRIHFEFHLCKLSKWKANGVIKAFLLGMGKPQISSSAFHSFPSAPGSLTQPTLPSEQLPGWGEVQRSTAMAKTPQPTQATGPPTSSGVYWVLSSVFFFSFFVSVLLS